MKKYIAIGAALVALAFVAAACSKKTAPVLTPVEYLDKVHPVAKPVAKPAAKPVKRPVVKPKPVQPAPKKCMDLDAICHILN